MLWLGVVWLCWTSWTFASLPVSRLLDLPHTRLADDTLRSFSYDAENQLTTNWVANAWKQEFVYDAFGRKRIERTYGWSAGAWSKTNETRYVYDGLLAIQERNSTNGVLVTYTRGLDLSASLARTDGSGSAFYHADGTGNVTTLIDARNNIAARYEFDPFGRQLAQWGPLADANRYRFSSKELQPLSGLYYYGFRYLDPSLQRWPNQDPIGEAGGLNLHRFVGNSPLNTVDPYGLDFHLYNSGPGDGTVFVSGPMSYVTGDTALEQLASGAADIVPMAGNLMYNSGHGVLKLLGVLDQATEDFLAWFTGDSQLAKSLNNVLAVAPIGWPEKLGKLGKLEKAAAECEKAAKTISTGRTVPNSLKEKLAMEQVMAKPMGTTPPRMPPMSDTKNNLLAADGWVKRVQNVNGVEIHYVENTKTGQVLDFKFKD